MVRLSLFPGNRNLNIWVLLMNVAVVYWNVIVKK